MITSSAPRWLKSLTVYADRRVCAVLFLGFSSGLPLALTGQSLAVWLSESGISLSSIGLFALVGLPYMLKFLWAPVIDAVNVPVLTRYLGRRRSWMITTQVLLIISILSLGSLDPLADTVAIASIAILVAFCSASQDIVIDAFRIESLSESQQAAGMANYVAGYRGALLISTAGLFELVSFLEVSGFDRGWLIGYAAVAGAVVVGIVTALLSKEPVLIQSDEFETTSLRARFKGAVIAPFTDFTNRTNWLLILLFVVLFKFGDSLAGVMTAPFVLDIGFDKTDYGRVVKLFGFAAVLIGGFVGGYVYRTVGAVGSLWIAGLVQMLSNLMFVWQASVGAEMMLLIFTIVVENLAGGLGTVIFVAYISALCINRNYTATQFALLTALSAVGRTLLSASSGWFADSLGWGPFFLLTTGAALPGLLLLWWLTRHGLPGERPAY